MNCRSVAAVAAATFAAMVAARGASAADYEWKMFTYFGANDLPARIDKDFAADVTKATDGRLKIDVFSAGELPYSFSDVLRAIATDQIQMGDIAVGLNVGELPGLNVYDLPFLCTSFGSFYEASEKTDPIIDEVIRKKFNIGALIHWTMPPQQIWLTDPIKNIQGLKGRKIRIWSRMHVDMLDKFGTSGVTVTAAEVTTALERRVVDGSITAAAAANDWHFYEVAPYGYMLNFQMAPVIMAVNLAEFGKLPKDIQDILKEKAQEWTAKYRERVEAGEKQARAALKSKGETLIMPSEADIKEARNRTKPIWQDWAKKGGEVSQELLADATSACVQ
jgi:TRAP-type C4-dicarboxylate transport system substrate-binding protein